MGANEPIERDEDASTAYRWTVRSLYVFALGLNVWILWRATADDVEVAIVRARIRDAWRRATAPLRAESDWRKSLNRMRYQVAETLEEVE